MLSRYETRDKINTIKHTERRFIEDRRTRNYDIGTSDLKTSDLKVLNIQQLGKNTCKGQISCASKSTGFFPM